MHVAVNYSPQAAALVVRGVIHLDWFKVPEQAEYVAQAAQVRPCYVHFRFRAGRGNLNAVNWAEVAHLVETSHTAYVNMHLAPSAADFPGMRLDTHDPADRDRLIEAMRRDVAQMVARFGAERLALENVMWDPDPPWLIPAPALEAAVIRQVVAEADCGFILDLAHAVITARHFRIDEQRYIADLPTERLREIHVSGLRLCEDGLWRDHHPMTEDDWRTLEWALDRVRRGDWPRPEVFTLEYGGVGPGYEERTDPAALAAQVPRLCAMVENGV